MNKKWKSVSLALATAILVAFLLVATFTDPLKTTKNADDMPEGVSSQLSEKESPLRNLENTSIVINQQESVSPVNTEQQLSLARTEFDEAISALIIAEREFDALGIELEEAENYVDKLQREGEDPAKYAEEGMLLLRPVIEKYETRLAIVEAAEARVELARQRLNDMEENMSGEK